ncbi:hypothetical protein FZEAL_6332 [Fusarium zealandicum]|uniref:Siderophore iron transporter mirB n=1 Tax=Fusarium zealandicum TaxID=1053134 RepID=A0A8H4XJL0_9HYPO|nr:hypothetical protein FZEAL_6332 [Fusarium zealandicum]
MSILDKLRGRNSANSDHDNSDVVTDTVVNTDKETSAGLPDQVDQGHESSAPSEDVQNGVQEIQAITITWGKKSLAALLCLIWLLFFTSGMRLSIFTSTLPYLTSEWAAHSLLNTIYIVSGAMTSACYIPMAKALDVWGRAEGFLLMVAFATLGMIMMAAANSLATFCAAQIFYSVGFNGLIYCVGVLAADATSLKNRGLAFAFTSSPYMITAFAGSKAAEAFVVNVNNWRWGFGCFCIILPCVSIPLYGILKYHLHQAMKSGVIHRHKSERTLAQKLKYFVVEFDLMGIFLFGAGLVIFLLPFNLAAMAPKQWKTDYIIAMLVVGFVLLVCFGLWEYFLSPRPFLRGKFLTDRTVVAACLIDMTYQASYATWNHYFQSFLQVVCNLTVSEAGYVNSTFQVVSGVLLFIIGWGVRKTGYFKWQFYWAVPLYVFALGLMMHFRQPNQYIGYIVMCEIFISMGGSVFILIMQLAVLAAVEHQYVAAALATLYVSGGIGSSIGSAISGAIWTNTFLPELMRTLPESELPNVALIYGDLVTQLSYPVGSETRIIIQKAYGYGQIRMLGAGVGIASLCFFWTAMMRNINVKKTKQTKGVVF